VGDHVTTADGTGIVHTAPGFGEEDYEVLRGTGIPTVCPIDEECKFTDEVPDYKGLFVKDSDKLIMERLKKEGKLIKREQILHAILTAGAVVARSSIGLSRAGLSRSNQLRNRC